ncbi:MAG: 2-amino-4-hydroxy-6-hydroxymethyldihydropteridine diphosphokinase [Candidatus Syntrophonatronum acetioxidans]|uniref:2-amino-4-hydroxy-6-hydroxymethyldihydropteridine diphosphokinase n=1 Tax=Candidatus Syntrophonatronum acetioxidans TaxID=1795816 RepID=A0A424YBT8_9FIRM|nr:MAG: 2-amino-4-hydroxy-6-hydroxymethyldihydropteridine diphosphokinase [Candidatus Syntrophonatronum acetioxidans]
MVLVCLGLGSNMGDREKNLKEAVKALDYHEHISVEKVSSLYETDPVGYTDQDKFLNAAVFCKTRLTPYQLLDYLQEIEKDLKRVRTVPWGPRPIDLDILLYDDLQLTDEPRLIIPHPRMTEREFVLLPLAEIVPEVIHPTTGKSIKKLLEELKKGRPC